MAKVSGPLMSVDASGRFGAMVYSKGGFVRVFVPPANPQTDAQMLVRNTMGDIQRSLKQLGPTLRAELKTGFGPRWNSIIVGELTKNNHAQLDVYNAELAAFTGPQIAAWDTADLSTPVELTSGQPLYATASAIFDIAARIGADVTLTEPGAANAATVGGEWIA